MFYVDGRTDGQRDRTKQLATFLRFAKALKKYSLLHKNTLGFQGRDVSSKKIIITWGERLLQTFTVRFTVVTMVTALAINKL